MPEEGLDRLVRLDRLSIAGHFLWVEINRDEDLEEVAIQVTECLRSMILCGLPPNPDYFMKDNGPVNP